jgi:hypothetical protein
MLKLAGGTHFLVLRTGGGRRVVDCFRRFDEAVAKHDGSSRISPIFAVSNAPPPTCSEDTLSYLLFVGPKYPGDVEVPDKVDCFLSLGLLNILFYIRSQEIADTFRASLSTGETGWECWTIRGGVIDDIQCGFPGRSTLRDEISAPLVVDRKSLVPTAREFQTALASAVGKAQLYKQPTEQRLLNYNTVLRNFLMNGSVRDVERQQSLAIANVSIARLNWQTYGGTSQILETSIPLAMHSLLGIGTPVLALQALTSFVERAFELFPTRSWLSRLKNRPARRGTSLIGTPATDGFWTQDFLSLAPGEVQEQLEGPNLPLFATFSGRDGFRSTSISLSAPNESITGCNTPSWTLQTLTHEMSHTQIRIALGFLLPSSQQEQDSLWSTIRDSEAATNLLDQVRVFLAEAIRNLGAQGIHEALTRDQFFVALKENLHEAHEILAHVFDLMYFYQGDEKAYLRAVWVSWASIPHIEDRVKNYVVRVLCALYANSLRRDDGAELTLQTVETTLLELDQEFPESLYIPEALAELQGNRKAYLDKLRLRSPLVKFARHFLWSKDAAKILSKGADLAQSLTSGAFTEERVKNPLAFLGAWSRDKVPEPIRSIWILQQLALGVEH